MRSEIIAGNLRDLSYIAANLRPEDRAEVDCQFAHWTPSGLGAAALRGLSHVVLLDGNPEAAFGAAPTPNPGLWMAWSWGTRRFPRCASVIIAHVREHLIPELLQLGCRRCEARALARHEAAHRFLCRMGAKEQGLLSCYGCNGEDFKLFEWTQNNVLQSSCGADAETAETLSPADSSQRQQQCGAPCRTPPAGETQAG